MSSFPAPAPVNVPFKILVVEDEGIIANHIASRLLKTGYEVAGVAESSEEALASVARSQPSLILMDIRIKGSLDGIDTAVKIRETYDIPVIYLTGNSDQETIGRARMTGASGFLTKPIHHASLATSIEMAIHKHRADLGIRQQRAWMATVLGTMANAVVVVDSERRVQFFNRHAEELTGWPDDQARGRLLSEILPLAEASTGLEASDAFLTASEPRASFQLPEGLIACRRSGSWFPVEGEVATSFDDRKLAGFVITFRDATARRTKQAELLHEQKMQAVGRLAAGTAHDFNNLLFVIIGYTEELMRRSALEDSDRRALEEIRKAGDHAAEITQRLLSFSRKEPVVKRELNVNDIIRDTEELFRRLAGPAVSWRFTLEPHLETVLADPGQMKQVLMNLVANARDAMAEGGTIAIETANVEMPGKPFRNSNARMVEVSVADSGDGMSAETAEHLFEPFFTTREMGKGTGLGLSIVHNIISDLGGTIQVHSEPGQGSRFTLRIPASGSVPALTDEVPPPGGRDEAASSAA